jgi:hypothetical protein
VLDEVGRHSVVGRGVARPLDEICVIEIGNAMVAVAAQTGGIQPGDLKCEALSLLSGRRIAIGIRLDAAFSQAITNGFLVQSNTGVVGAEIGAVGR